jgi:hypothetical protein
MPLDERRERHDTLFQALLVNNAESWGERFLSSLLRPFCNGLAVDIPGKQPLDSWTVWKSTTPVLVQAAMSLEAAR